jgi:hypothetical protein
LETLGNIGVEYRRGSHSYVAADNAERLDIVRDAGDKGKIISMAKEKDQESERDIREKVIVGSGIFCIDSWNR